MVLIACALTSGFLVHKNLMAMMDDGKTVNFSGKIRGGSQRLIKFELIKKYEEADKLIDTIEKIIKGIINGDTSLGIQKATDELLISEMNKVELAWKNLRQTITDTRVNPSRGSQLIKESEDFFKLTEDATAAAAKLSANHVQNVNFILILSVCFNIMVLALVWVLSRKKILNPIKHLSGRVAGIINKDLRLTITCGRNDEICGLANDMNKLIDFFNDVIKNSITSINNVVNTMDIVREKTDRATDGAKEQLSQTMLMASASTKMSQTITDIAGSASQAAETSFNSMKVADKGKAIAISAMDTVSVVNSTTSELAALIGTLNNRVNEIGDILSVINDIADQTNLLALNAAIEAARAGEQGRGFAVVADEVRKLAEKTKIATMEISDKITAVQSGSQVTAKSMGIASDEVGKTTELMSQVSDVLNEIAIAAVEVRDQIANIASAIEEQAATANEVAQNVEKTAVISQEMERESTEVMKEVNKMIVSAEEVRKTTSGFKTKDSDMLILDLTMTDHRMWVNKILFCIKGGGSIDPKTLLDHTACRLGQWYYTDGKELCGHMSSFSAMELPHKRLHALGKEIVSVYNTGNEQRAKEMFEELEKLSKEVIAALKETKENLAGRLGSNNPKALSH
ncbi:methyl-accepting chemotaxis protein [Candidatus Magnetominusculus xianensis]|uniref:methyl-accepting chemotaxis protein n=1 Tax=Candidatus Magnetominusculus xianensis TaxID=1748249 RepID=UPI0012EE4682|nr:methyl-accepting chemotaxis protein [Candidatus Magnetominusculus xianensis]MBF0404778.1 CZB domain-containing protein [Nitrospirota bacterium]